MMTHDEILAAVVAEARLSRQEPGKVVPYVAAAVLLPDGSLHLAHRGEVKAGEHAEFTLLERKLEHVALAGTTVYATLEPCTIRGHGKIPCADRLISRKVRAVWIGMLDPNPDIRGHGLRRLTQAGIEVQIFPQRYYNEVEEMNRNFSRLHDSPPTDEAGRKVFAKDLENTSLDDWYQIVNKLYWNRNFQRSPSELLAHLVEVVGALSHLASNKKKTGITAESYIPKAIAWWLTLCGKLGVKSVETMLWGKFPGVCTYCVKSPHQDSICRETKKNNPTAPWEQLRSIGKQNERPQSLSDWQRMFDTIYPTPQTESYGPTFARLSEELGELAEAVRIFPAEPGYFLSEASDVFAWLMHLANVHETVTEVSHSKRSTKINLDMALAYPGYCADCGERVCKCAPILPSTIGRIAHEVPPDTSGYGEQGSFLTPNQLRQKFSG